jgi:hypothetical protein
MTANSNSSLTSMIVVCVLILTNGVRTCESLIQIAVLNLQSRVTSIPLELCLLISGVFIPGVVQHLDLRHSD